MEKIDLSVIILNYNAKLFVKKCLESIERASKDRYKWEVIVVDNASSDGSVEAIKKCISNFSAKGGLASDWQLIENKKNLGFSRGNNAAVPKAKGRYLLFLNPDTIVNKNTFSYMLRFMNQHPGVGAATCKLKLPTGGLDEAAHRGFPTPWNAFYHFFVIERIFPTSRFFSGYTLGYLPKNTTHEIDALCGAFMIVRREAGEEMGWWDEDYFWYGEDIDFCYRLKQKGWKIMYVPQVSILHYKGISSGVKRYSREFSTASRKTRRAAAQASIDAMRIFYRKHYIGRYPAPVLWLVWAGIWVLEKYRLLFW